MPLLSVEAIEIYGKKKKESTTLITWKLSFLSHKMGTVEPVLSTPHDSVRIK